jgi:hypothetical protein
VAKAKETRYVLKVIPHHKQRYETLGDWIPGKPARMMVSKLSNPDYEFLVLFHEFVEHELCKKRGIRDSVVVAFDKKFEKERAQGLHSKSAEPGASANAPYRREHLFATRLEKLMAKELGVSWNKYNRAAMRLYNKRK